MFLFGVDQKGKINDCIKEFLDSNINDRERNLVDLRSKAKLVIEKSQDNHKMHADEKRKEAHEYPEGDYVMIRNFESSPGFSQKLLPCFKGPYEIARILRNNRYIVKDIEGFQISNRKYEGVWEAKNMKLWSKKQNSN
ncbi:hypothetical protein QAD02_013023 [Eretmocerus hayati]|uniref:Uncharacterized protein n=1 Tax=Eretmocerus hayati TaxID=131215 RepID=A0ACC2P2E8_9HYME|nr:hypothetical protein QAD02_013023 [Eretmocerus hayati]